MENFSRNSEKVEGFSDWRELIKESPSKAKELISGIAGFDSMEYSGKITALTELIDTLLENNNNRYIAREIARHQEKIDATARYEKRMVELGVKS